jgi:hypothetical protein
MIRLRFATPEVIFMPRFIVLAVLALAIVGSVSSSTAARHSRSIGSANHQGAIVV